MDDKEMLREYNRLKLREEVYRKELEIAKNTLPNKMTRFPISICAMTYWHIKRLAVKVRNGIRKILRRGR